MISTVLAIASASVLVVGGLAFVFKYEPIIAQFWSQIYDKVVEYMDLLPDWFLPFSGAVLLLGGLSLLVRLL